MKMTPEEITACLDSIRKENFLPGDLFLLGMKDNVPFSVMRDLADALSERYPGVMFVCLVPPITAHRFAHFPSMPPTQEMIDDALSKFDIRKALLEMIDDPTQWKKVE